MMPSSATTSSNSYERAVLDRYKQLREIPGRREFAERWVGSVCREMPDHVIPLNERHLRRLCLEYLA
jgi:hypothetical protein